MSLRDRVHKTLYFIAIGSYFIGGYTIINLLSSKKAILYHLDLPFESKIHLYPALIFAYVLEFAFMGFGYLAIDDLEFFKRAVKAFFVCATIHFFVFAAFPVEYGLRPVVNPDLGWAYYLVDFYYWLDLPYNCFPSLHVSTVFLVSFFMNKYRPGIGWILYPLASLVAVSVVLVKQHYVADVVSGFFVAWFSYQQVFGERESLASAIEPLAARADPVPYLVPESAVFMHHPHPSPLPQVERE